MTELLPDNQKQNTTNYVNLLLRDVALDPVFDPETLQWDDSLVGLVQQQPDNLKRIVMFRAFTPPEVPTDAKELSVQQLTNKPESETSIGNSVHGVGIYSGNSVESVSRFDWEKDYHLGVLLSPPVSDVDIKNLLAPKDNFSTKAKNFASMTTRVLKAKTDKQGYLGWYEELYGTSKLVVMDKPINMRLAQRAVGEVFRYPVRPVWYLWRDTDGSFTQIGTATKRVDMGNLRHKALSIRYPDRFIK